MNIRNVRFYIESFLKIRTKEGNVVPLRMNKPQQRLYGAVAAQKRAKKPVRVLILKARQMGFSTLVEALLFALTATEENAEAMVVAHKDEATANLFRMSKRFYDELPPMIRPMQRASNARELLFDAPARGGNGRKGLASRIRCATAGGQGVGRSYTLKYLHLSEFAFWPGDKMETFSGLMQAVPDHPDTAVFIESTANGFDEFKAMWDEAVTAQREGREGFVPIFFPWFEMDEYRRAVPPSFVRTAEEEELAATFSLDDEQLSWRRWCIAVNCGGDLNKFHQEYPASPEEAFIATGHCVFNKEALVRRIEQVRGDKWERGRFRIEYDFTGKRIASFVWDKDDKGPIRVRKHPEEGVPYVLGGDTAGTGSDFFTGQMIDNRTGEQVAVLKQRFGERAYAEQMYCLGLYYNKALIGVETNYSTYPVMVLAELHYPKLYVRERFDTFTGKLAEAYGFETTSTTRPVIIDGLKDVASYALDTIYDFETLQEMLVFVYNENYRPEAMAGEHDDLVMALAITHAIRSQQTTRLTEKASAGRAGWSKRMKEDYARATPEQKKYLLEKWSGAYHHEEE